MIRPRKFFAIAATSLFLALFGGAQFYVKPWGVWFVLGMMILINLGMLIKLPSTSGAFLVFFPVFIAILISSAANLDIFQATFSRLILFFAFLVSILGAHNLLSRADVFNGLSLAGALWPGIWLIAQLLGWQDNSNIIAAWSVIFIAVSLAGRNWWVLFAHILLLLWLNSQGAIMGAIVAAGVIYPYWQRFNLKTLILSGLGIMAGLIAWQPISALCRLYYWKCAWAAFLLRPVFGVGPGGLYARHLLPELRGGYQIHAHNILITTMTELGLIGLAAVAIMGFLLTRFRGEMTRWQLAIIAGMLAHSMVDEPLWWPGPLLVFAMVVGSIQNVAAKSNR